MSIPHPPRSQDELTKSLPYLITRLSALAQATQNRLLSDRDLNLAMLRTLSTLYIEDGLTINEIAFRTFMEQSSASRIVDAMVGQGLLERQIPEHDQRQRVIVLTQAGKDRLLNGWPAMADFYDILTDGVSQGERDVIRDLLSRMIENLDRQQRKA